MRLRRLIRWIQRLVDEAFVNLKPIYCTNYKRSIYIHHLFDWHDVLFDGFEYYTVDLSIWIQVLEYLFVVVIGGTDE